MSRRATGAVAVLLLALFTVVYAPLSASADRTVAPDAAIMLASGVGLSPVTPHPATCDLFPPGPGLAPPGRPGPLAPPPSRPFPAAPALLDDSSPRAPPSSDL
ncbi:hypothetical protein FHS43_001333 [Streptosporangium becharense]|uniref:Uncharacterized protein n=1 Tax=Streptosporangium becharense TaxID=1816182 RepID=A0A7W9IDX3_9ACTN|nr:hypothetical protein [Streptosporangium becharense]MBB2910087.1 hypothetical protein [Streptosporangium becharense]MBB5818958.1 hypothetical protein [Streptosporangium becharense]